MKASVTLGPYEGGFLIWEKLGAVSHGARHMRNIPKEKVLELWRKLSQGKVDEINEELWAPGYGS
jgi:hypothetical protein